MKKYILISAAVIIIANSPASANNDKFADNVVSITVTSQGYDYNAPWQKLSVQKEVISGVVLKGNRILTLAHKLADHVLIEVSKFGEYRKYPANILLLDYQSGLAILTVPDGNFFNSLKPVEFNANGTLKDSKALIVRWSTNGILKNHSAEYQKSSIEFFDSIGTVLIHEMISDMDFGGLGEPVFVKSRLAGITISYSTKSKAVKLIDIKVAERMLKDLQSGKYKGMPFFNIDDVPLESDNNLREYLGLNPADTGILVIGVPTMTSGSEVLKKDDVILKVNSVNIDDNGLYDSGKYGKLEYYGLVSMDRFVGDTVKMLILRNKKKMDVSFKLKPFTENSFLVPTAIYDTPPKYYIIGGFIFQELSKNYLKIWGEEWPSTADKRLMYYFENYAKYPSPDKKRIVILTSVLPSSVSVGYHNAKNLILSSVNGQQLKDLAHLKMIIDKSNDKFLKFDFVGGSRIVLNESEVKKSTPEILNRYKIQPSFYLEDN